MTGGRGWKRLEEAVKEVAKEKKLRAIPEEVPKKIMKRVRGTQKMGFCTGNKEERES